MNVNFSEPVALCADEDLRLPSLFFDKLFLVAGKQDVVPPEVQLNLRHLISESEYEQFNKTAVDYIMRGIKDKSPKIAENAYVRICNSLVNIFHKKCLSAGIPCVPFLMDGDTFDDYGSGGKNITAEIQITQVPLIDVSELTWEHISTVRQDPSFKSYLRRFRLMLAEDYVGKSSAFIIDSLNRKIEQYANVCTKHGLKLTIGSIRQLLDSKSLLGALSIAAIGFLTGNHVIVGLSAVSGSAIEIGKLALYIAEKKIDFATHRDNLDIAYLMLLKEKGVL